MFRAIDVQRSFCDGSISREDIEIEISIIQAGDEITMVFPDEPEDQIFEGRTSKYFIGAESNEESQVTVLSGGISQNANSIFGTIVFFDKHECPDAETGSARYVIYRNGPGMELCECDLNSDGKCDMLDWLLFGEDWGRIDCPIP